MKKFTFWILCGTFLALGLLLGYSRWQNNRLEGQLMRAQAQFEKAELEAAGFRKASVGKASSPTLLPDLPPAPASAKDPEISIHLKTEEAKIQVQVPCPPSPQSGEMPNLEDSLKTVQLDIGLTTDVQARLDLTKDGQIYWTGLVQSYIRVDKNDPVKVSQPLLPSSEISISPTLQKTLKRGMEPAQRFALAPRSPKKWRVGWVAGLGCSVYPDPSCGPIVAWGVQF